MAWKLSVIVPVYQTQQYLKTCVDSILRQTYRNLEVILVDDGSKDDSPGICDGYETADHRVKVIHQENRGLSAARNAALDCCTGDVIAFVDSDDWLEPDAYRILLERMEAQNLDIVFCAANIIEGTVKTGERFHYFADGTVLPAEKVMALCLTDAIGGQAWLKVYRKHCFEKVRFPEGRLYEDLAVSHLPFFFAKRPVGFVDRPLYCYRMNPEGISLSHDPRKTGHIFLGFWDHYVFARETCPDVLDACLEKTARFALGACHEAIRHPQIRQRQGTKQAEGFLRQHLPEIRKCANLPRRYKAAMVLHVRARGLYGLVFSAADKLRKKWKR